MKIFGFTSLVRDFRRSSPGNRGAALIVVLALIVLLAALVTVFLVRTNTSRATSASYDAAANTRMLAESTINLVQATINEATAGSPGVAWASQPGAIRLFNDAGALTSIYRLYSGSSLVTNTSDASVLAGDIPPANWSSQSALWVDLNKPVTVSGFSAQNTLVYPILDPRDPKNPGSVSAPNVLTDLSGFSLGTAPGATPAQPAPMPVRWLYVLRNGEIIAPNGGSGSTATFGGTTAVPSPLNPIVGRIAFWTDDETCKVNLNTASGSRSTRTIASGSSALLPAPWDTPRFKIYDEKVSFSENQPILGEYQRYPGHPATTDLSTIFTALGIPIGSYPITQTASGTSSDFFNLLPKYDDKTGSKAGTVNTTSSSNPPTIVSKTDRLYAAAGEMLFRPDRLENPNGTAPGVTRQQVESGKFLLTSHSRAPEVNLFGRPRIAIWPVDVTESRRTTFDKLIAFCATTGTGNSKHPYYFQRSDSRSPNNDYDNIQRNQDLYRYLLDLTSRQIPGFQGSFSAKYNASNERDQILTEMVDYIRSTNLYDHSGTSTTLPRFTSSGGGKAQVTPLKITEAGVTTHGLGRINTISEIGIHIICTADGNSPLGPYQPPTTVGGAQVSPVKGSANDPLYASNLPDAQYLRDASGVNGAIVGWTGSTTIAGTETQLPAAAGPFPANPTLTTDGKYGGTLAALALGERKYQAMLLFEIASPAMGFDPMTPSYQITVSNIQGITIASDAPFPGGTPSASGAGSNGNGSVAGPAARDNFTYNTGGLTGFRHMLTDFRNSGTTYYNGRYNGWSGESPAFIKTSPYRFVSNPFKVSDATAMTLGGGFSFDLQVSGTTYQTFNVNFPGTTVPRPDLPRFGIGGTINASNFTSIPADWWGFDKRIAWTTSDSITADNTPTPNLARGCVIRSDLVSGTSPWNYALSGAVPISFYSAPAASSDVVRTLVARDGDYRLVAGAGTIAATDAANSLFEKGPGYDNATLKIGNLFKEQRSSNGTVGCDKGGKLVQGAAYAYQIVPKVPSTMDPNKQISWDWDTGLPAEPDGAYSNKPDEGNTYRGSANEVSPYYNRETQATNDIVSYFTANRIIPSPVMFGSLPTGVKEGISWRTLLFRPSPQTNRPFDPTGPKDYLLLDLFNMPVVEPYAISEPFSTGGKVNMNYQIVPFTYINRSTAVRAVLSSELIARVAKSSAAVIPGFAPHSYYKVRDQTQMPKLSPGYTPPSPSLARLPVDLDQTLKQFDTKFSGWNVFKSAAEICDIYLVPKDDTRGYAWPGFDSTWYGDDFAMVGDNVRERPYANIYSRLTTKSNTFTVHYTVQALKNPPGANPAQWNESSGVVTGQLRGSTTLERFLDPADSNIKDYATDLSLPSLDTFYQWRVIATNTFAP